MYCGVYSNTKAKSNVVSYIEGNSKESCFFI
jgi:hypothetical protein